MLSHVPGLYEDWVIFRIGEPVYRGRVFGVRTRRAQKVRTTQIFLHEFLRKMQFLGWVAREQDHLDTVIYQRPPPTGVPIYTNISFYFLGLYNIIYTIIPQSSSIPQ